MYRVFVVWRRGSRFRHNIEHRSVLKELLPPTGNRGLLESLGKINTTITKQG